MSVSHKKGDYKKYFVGGGAMHHFAFTDTLAEAKREGAIIAKKEAWRGKWNVMFVSVNISEQDAPHSPYYRGTGWVMYVPVRGSGASADRILAEIKRRHGVAPFVWTREK